MENLVVACLVLTEQLSPSRAFKMRHVKHSFETYQLG